MLIEILSEENAVDAADLERAAKRQREQGGSLAEWLLRVGVLAEDDLFFLLSRRLGVSPMPEERLRHLTIAPELRQRVPRRFAEKWVLLPLDLDRSRGALSVAMLDPSDGAALEALRTRARVGRVRTYLARRSAILAALDRVYDASDELDVDIDPDELPLLETDDEGFEAGDTQVAMIPGKVEIDPLLAQEIAALDAHAGGGASVQSTLRGDGHAAASDSLASQRSPQRASVAPLRADPALGTPVASIDEGAYEAREPLENAFAPTGEDVAEYLATRIQRTDRRDVVGVAGMPPVPASTRAERSGADMAAMLRGAELPEVPEVEEADAPEPEEEIEQREAWQETGQYGTARPSRGPLDHTHEVDLDELAAEEVTGVDDFESRIVEQHAAPPDEMFASRLPAAGDRTPVAELDLGAPTAADNLDTGTHAIDVDALDVEDDPDQDDGVGRDTADLEDELDISGVAVDEDIERARRAPRESRVAAAAAAAAEGARTLLHMPAAGIDEHEPATAITPTPEPSAADLEQAHAAAAAAAAAEAQLSAAAVAAPREPTRRSAARASLPIVHDLFAAVGVLASMLEERIDPGGALSREYARLARLVAREAGMDEMAIGRAALAAHLCGLDFALRRELGGPASTRPADVTVIFAATPRTPGGLNPTLRLVGARALGLAPNAQDDGVPLSYAAQLVQMISDYLELRAETEGEADDVETVVQLLRTGGANPKLLEALTRAVEAERELPQTQTRHGAPAARPRNNEDDRDGR